MKDAELKSGSKDKTLQALERELCTIKQTLARVLQENSDLKRREAEARNRQIELEGLVNEERLLREQVSYAFDIQEKRNSERAYADLLRKFRSVEEEYNTIISEKNSVETVRISSFSYSPIPQLTN